MEQGVRSEAASLTRREAIAALAALALPAAAAGQTIPAGEHLGIPGPYPGRIVHVSHPAVVVDGAVRRDTVRKMMERGMRALTGAADEASAWKRFFKPGDVVGVKVCPVGYPRAI